MTVYGKCIAVVCMFAGLLVHRPSVHSVEVVLLAGSHASNIAADDNADAAHMRRLVGLRRVALR